MSIFKSQLKWILLSIAIFFIDLVSKILATKFLVLGSPSFIVSFFNLTLLHNYGAAFSFLSDAKTIWQVVFLSLIAVGAIIAIIIWLSRLPANKNMHGIALSLILGGAIGNLYNRIIDGYVVDFIDVHIHGYHWPAFNVADSSIFVGAIIIVLLTVFSKNK